MLKSFLWNYLIDVLLPQQRLKVTNKDTINKRKLLHDLFIEHTNYMQYSFQFIDTCFCFPVIAVLK